MALSPLGLHQMVAGYKEQVEAYAAAVKAILPERRTAKPLKPADKRFNERRRQAIYYLGKRNLGAAKWAARHVVPHKELLAIEMLIFGHPIIAMHPDPRQQYRRS